MNRKRTVLVASVSRPYGTETRRVNTFSTSATVYSGCTHGSA